MSGGCVAAFGLLLARTLSDTFAGIAPGDVVAFIAAQMIGMLVAVGLARWLFREQ